MVEHRAVGTSVPRMDGADKVTGTTRYAADIHPPGTLWGKILRSPHPHARILSIDTVRAQQVPGVKAIITGPEISGHLMGKQIRDMPVLCWEVVRFIGDRVAAVAAETLAAAEAAVALINVEYELLPAVFDPDAATKPGAPLLHENVAAYAGAPQERLATDIHNGLTRLAWGKGDIAEGFQQADLTLEHTFHIPARHQGYIEPHACVVSVSTDGRIQVWASTKDPFRTRRQLSEAINLPEDKICIHPVSVGGEFGGKGDALDLPVAYFLAVKSGHPVKIIMTYAEELAASNPAHPTVVTIRSGLMRDGSIVAREIHAVHASGAYGALKNNASLATWHYAGGLYRVDNASMEFLQVYTNTVPGGYYRSPGSIAMFLALESHTDIIARELGLDPGEFRLRNLVAEGGEDALGTTLENVRFREVLERALDAAHWQEPIRQKNRGRGVALYGRHIAGGETGIVLSAETDGTLTILSPTFDQGSGTHTILRQMVADEMGVAIERVRVVVGDTDTAPYDTGARASRVTYVAGRATLRACRDLKDQLRGQVAGFLGTTAAAIEYKAGGFRKKTEAGVNLSLTQTMTRLRQRVTVTVNENAPAPNDVTYVCAQVADVEVDPETGELTIHRFITVHDVGTVINPITHQGQIDGGAVMGLGQALSEELVTADGRIINANLGDYKLPTIADIPHLETILLSSEGGVGPYGAKAIGELANNIPPAAIANAVADAVGVRLFEIPITAEKIHRALTADPSTVNRRTSDARHRTLDCQ